MRIFIFLAILAPSLVSCSRSVYLEELNGQTVSVPLDSRVVNEFGKQILSIMNMEKPPQAREKRDGRIEHFMTQLYRQMDEYPRSNDIYKYQLADQILSIPVVVKRSTSDTSIIELQYSPADLLEIQQKVNIAQLVMYLSHTGAISVEILKDRSIQSGSPAEALISQDDNSVTVDLTSIITDKKANPEDMASLFVRLHSDLQTFDPKVIDAFIVVGFGDDTVQVAPNFSQRRIRRSADENNSGKRKSNDENRADSTKSAYSTGCVRNALYIDFKQLGWDSWLIAPSGYDAYFCLGSCKFPLNDKTNSTNHAIVQTLSHMVHPDRAEEAKCVPTELSPTKILFTDEKKHVRMRKYKDMVVESCGCQ